MESNKTHNVRIQVAEHFKNILGLGFKNVPSIIILWRPSVGVHSDFFPMMLLHKSGIKMKISHLD